MLVWYEVRADGGSGRCGVGIYFRQFTEPVLFDVRGHRRMPAPGVDR